MEYFPSKFTSAVLAVCCLPTSFSLPAYLSGKAEWEKGMSKTPTKQNLDAAQAVLSDSQNTDVLSMLF